MFQWLAENMATIVVFFVLIAVVTAILVSMARGKKNGKSSCGCGCEGCATSDSCHKE